jgi:hypothetical protein
VQNLLVDLPPVLKPDCSLVINLVAAKAPVWYIPASLCLRAGQEVIE